MFIKQWCIAYKNGSEFGEVSIDMKNMSKGFEHNMSKSKARN